MKSSSVPFRIIGRINGSLIILRTYADHVSISVGGETRSFPSYGSAMEYLRNMTTGKRTDREGVSHEYTHRGQP